ncbi:MAG: hypothetical protein ACK4UV_12235, partial [Ignavibacterium sp.]
GMLVVPAVMPVTTAFADAEHHQAATANQAASAPALSAEQLADLVIKYGKAAENAAKAGFDGVEVQGAKGSLLHQLFMTAVTGENQASGVKFLADVVDAVKQHFPQDGRVGVRLSTAAGLCCVVQPISLSLSLSLCCIRSSACRVPFWAHAVPLSPFATASHSRLSCLTFPFSA